MVGQWQLRSPALPSEKIGTRSRSRPPSPADQPRPDPIVQLPMNIGLEGRSFLPGISGVKIIHGRSGSLVVPFTIGGEFCARFSVGQRYWAVESESCYACRSISSHKGSWGVKACGLKFWNAARWLAIPMFLSVSPCKTTLLYEEQVRGHWDKQRAGLRPSSGASSPTSVVRWHGVRYCAVWPELCWPDADGYWSQESLWEKDIIIISIIAFASFYMDIMITIDYQYHNY